MICQKCVREFPGSLVNDFAIGMSDGTEVVFKLCPICALEVTNRIADLPADTPFRGRMAREKHARALYHVKHKGLDTPPGPG